LIRIVEDKGIANYISWSGPFIVFVVHLIFHRYSLQRKPVIEIYEYNFTLAAAKLMQPVL